MYYEHEYEKGKKRNINVASIPQGHYNLVSLVNELKSSIVEKKSGIKLQFETNKPNSVFELFNPGHDSRQIKLTHDLVYLMGTATELGARTYVKKLNTPSAYFIHCDLIDPHKNFLNGKRSDVLAKIDIRGLPYDKATYTPLPQDFSCECSTSQHVNKITLYVKDESGEMFDFSGLPIEFVLELN